MNSARFFIVIKVSKKLIDDDSHLNIGENNDQFVLDSIYKIFNHLRSIFNEVKKLKIFNKKQKAFLFTSKII